MQENCKYPGLLREAGRGGLVQGKPGDPIPVSCSHVSLYSAAPNLFPPGSSTLVLSLIKKQYVAGLTCQIFKWPLYRQQRYQAAKNMGGGKKKTKQVAFHD